MPFQYYNTAIADSYQERPAGVSKYVGGITADGRILKWDTDDGEWESKRVGKRTFESLSQAEQEHLIYANKDEKGFFTGKPVIRDHCQVKQDDGRTIAVNEIRADVEKSREPEQLDPEPAEARPEGIATAGQQAAVPEVIAAERRADAPEGEGIRSGEVGPAPAEVEPRADESSQFFDYNDELAKGGLVTKRNRPKTNGKGLASSK